MSIQFAICTNAHHPAHAPRCVQLVGPCCRFYSHVVEALRAARWVFVGYTDIPHRQLFLTWLELSDEPDMQIIEAVCPVCRAASLLEHGRVYNFIPERQVAFVVIPHAEVDDYPAIMVS